VGLIISIKVHIFSKKRLGSALIWNVFLLQKFSHSTEFAFSKLIVSLPIIRN